MMEVLILNYAQEHSLKTDVPPKDRAKKKRNDGAH